MRNVMTFLTSVYTHCLVGTWSSALQEAKPRRAPRGACADEGAKQERGERPRSTRALLDAIAKIDHVDLDRFHIDEQDPIDGVGDAILEELSARSCGGDARGAAA